VPYRFLLALALAGCSAQVNYDGTSFVCERNGECPSGQFCGPDKRCTTSIHPFDSGVDAWSDTDADPNDTCRANALGSPTLSIRSIGDTAAALANVTGTISQGCSLLILDESVPSSVGPGDRIVAGGTTFHVKQIEQTGSAVLVQEVAEADYSGSAEFWRVHESIDAWNDALPQDLVSADRIERGVVYPDAPLTIPETIELGTPSGGSTVTTSATRYLEISAGVPHLGLPGQGIVIDGSSVPDLHSCFLLAANNIHVTGLSFTLCGRANGSASIRVQDGTSGALIGRVLIYDFDTAEAGAGIRIKQASATIHNSILFAGKDGIRGDTGATASIQNVTVYGMSADGIDEDGGSFDLYNVISVANGGADDKDGNGIRNSLITEDTIASGVGLITVTEPDDLFVAVPTNFHLASGTNPAVGVGVASSYPRDIDDELRTGAWDIGADQR
jgi:hypothetical protein